MRELSLDEVNLVSGGERDLYHAAREAGIATAEAIEDGLEWVAINMIQFMFTSDEG